MERVTGAATGFAKGFAAAAASETVGAGHKEK
jgi:hypothetical protein